MEQEVVEEAMTLNPLHPMSGNCTAIATQDLTPNLSSSNTTC